MMLAAFFLAGSVSVAMLPFATRRAACSKCYWGSAEAPMVNKRQHFMGSGFRLLVEDAFARSTTLPSILGRLPATLLRLRSGTGSAMELAAAVGVIGPDLARCPCTSPRTTSERVELGWVWEMI